MKFSEIKPNPNNPRIIKDDKFKKLVQSLKDFPQMMELRPIIIDEQNIIQGGNMRFKALLQLGYKEVPDEWIKKGKDLTEEQWREFVIKDNVGFGEWDFDILANEWEYEQLMGWGVDLPDFHESVNPEDGEDDIPEFLHENIIKKGDLIELNNHRLLCGDSCSNTDISLLTNEKVANLVFTDPPYDLENNRSWIDNLNKSIINGHIIIMIADKQLKQVVDMIDGEFHRMYIADTGIASPTNNDVYVNHILTLRFSKGKFQKFNNIHNGGRSIIKMDYRKNNKESEFHPHSKPISFVEQFILYWSDANDLVLDLFAGSGSTLIACEKNNRICYTNEFEPSHCDVILKRWIIYMKEHSKLFEIKINGEQFSNEQIEKLLN